MSSKTDWICTNCGYMSSEKFTDDICPKCGLTFWQCSECGFTINNSNPPDACPECRKTSCFVNLTCYIPDWNGPEYNYPHLLRNTDF